MLSKLMMPLRLGRSPLKPWRLNRPRQPRMVMILGANGREEKKAGKQLHQLKLQGKRWRLCFFGEMGSQGRVVPRVLATVGIA